MIEITISLFFFIIINFFSGIFALKFVLGLQLNEFTFSEKGLVGIVFLIFISFLFHFFLPLNEIVNLIIFILIFIFSFSCLETKKIFESKFFLLIFSFCFILTLLMTFKLKPHEDYGFYHLPYIINIISDKIIFGLSNIQPHYAWNSSWLNYSALYNLYFFNSKTIFLSNSVLIFYIIFFFIEKIIYKKKILTLSDLYIFCLACYVIIKFCRITEHGFDFPANIFLLLSFYFFIRFFEEPKRISYNLTLILLFSSICFTIKVSTFVGPFIFILTLYFYFFYYNRSTKNILRLLGFVSALYFFWFIQQIIYTSCFFPFFKFTCISTLSWSSNITDLISGNIGAFNKSITQYIGNLTAEEYVKNYNWVSTWAIRNKIEFLEHLVAYCIPVILFFIINKKKFIIKVKKNYLNTNVLNSFYILLILNVFGFVVWFHMSPVIRFGIPYLFFLIFFITIFPFILKKSLGKIFFYNFKLILILSLLFNFSKNLDRIIKKNQKTYWPILQEVKFNSFKKNGYTVNTPLKPGSTCWAIPYICFANLNKNIEIKNNKGYLFVLKK